jgi:hypothetical protein
VVSSGCGARVRIGLYSAIYGGYDWVKPVPASLGVPAVLFTDNHHTARSAQANGWEVVLDELPDLPTPMLRHKYWKCHADEALPNYDVSLWLDGSMTIDVDDYVERCVAALGDDDLVTVRHPWRSCVYDEAWYSATLPRYDAQALHAQVSYYQSIGHPSGWGLVATGANVRRHTAAVGELGRHWWWENLHRTHQDQVSLPVLLRIMGDRVRWNTNMPWNEWWGLHPHGH